MDASLEEAVRANAVVVVHRLCDPCLAEGAMRDRLARYGVPRRVRHATFENFQTDGSLEKLEAVQSVRRWIEEDELIFLTLFGAYGAGKGHLAAAAIRKLGMSARWLSHADLMDGYHALDYPGRPRYLNRIRACDEEEAKSLQEFAQRYGERSNPEGAGEGG